MKKHLLHSILLITHCSLLIGLASCEDNDDPVDITVRLNQTQLEYNADQVWEGVSSNNTVTCNLVSFAHEGEMGPWGLLWNGFTPARVSTTEEQSDWLSHQFQIMTGGGMSGTGTPYMVAFWDNQENETTPVQDRSCRVVYDGDLSTGGKLFRPTAVYVQNTAYTYYTMANGSPYSKQFTDEDWLMLTAHGVGDDSAERTTDFYLAKDGKYANDWTLFDLTPLGEVRWLYFTMSSSDTGQWGMNTPAYFALDCLTLTAVLPD